MGQEKHIETECSICKKDLEGDLMTQDETNTAVVKHIGNKSLGFICRNCQSAFCYEHKKELGFNLWSGYEKSVCPQCGEKIKGKLNIVHLIEPAPEEMAKKEQAASSPQFSSVSSLADLVRDLGAKAQYLEIIPKLSKSSINPEVDKALREVFAGVDDEEVLKKLSSNLRGGPSNAAGVFSGAALCYVNTPLAAHYLMEALATGDGFGSSINQVSLNGVVKTGLIEIGEVGLGQLLIEMENLSKDGRIPPFICGVISTYLTPENWDPVIKALYMRCYDGRKALALTLKAAGWKPVTDEHRAVLLIAEENWNELEKMGSNAESIIIDFLGLDDPGFIGISPFKKLIPVLGKTGSTDAADILLQLLEKGKYAKQVVEALGAIGDVRTARAILDHAQNAKGLKGLSPSAYANALAGIGPDVIPYLEEALKGDKKVKKIAEKALKMIR